MTDLGATHRTHGQALGSLSVRWDKQLARQARAIDTATRYTCLSILSEYAAQTRKRCRDGTSVHRAAENLESDWYVHTDHRRECTRRRTVSSNIYETVT